MARAAIKVEYIISEKQVPCSRVANYKIVDRDATKRGIVKNMWELEGKVRTFKMHTRILTQCKFICNLSEITIKIF